MLRLVTVCRPAKAFNFYPGHPDVCTAIIIIIMKKNRGQTLDLSAIPRVTRSITSPNLDGMVVHCKVKCHGFLWFTPFPFHLQVLEQCQECHHNNKF